MFPFQKLDVYRCAIEFQVMAEVLARGAPKGHGELASQIRRAALSIPLNIAEGSGKRGPDARRFYGIARGSVFECAATLDIMERLGISTQHLTAPARQLLARMAAMLTKMVGG